MGLCSNGFMRNGAIMVFYILLHKRGMFHRIPRYFCALKLLITSAGQWEPAIAQTVEGGDCRNGAIMPCAMIGKAAYAVMRCMNAIYTYIA